MAAIGQSTGNRYETTDIVALYAEMKEEVLLDDMDRLVVPVRAATPHFRVIGERGPSEIERRPNLEAHEAAVDYLIRNLGTKRPFRVSTFVFHKDNATEAVDAANSATWQEQVILRAEPGAVYRWHRGGNAAMRFEDGSLIIPDLVGAPITRIAPMTSCPGLVIEVIRTHRPGERTYARLKRLSQRGFLVAMWFIADDGAEESQLNRLWCKEGVVGLRVSAYLSGGKLYANGVEVLGAKGELSYIEAVTHVFEKFESKCRTTGH